MSEDDITWDMKRRLDKLDELKKKFPELIRMMEIAALYVKIMNFWTSDKDVGEAFEKLENLLDESRRDR